LALLPSPFGEKLLLLDLSLNLRLLQRPLAFEIQLPLHRHVLSRLVLLELPFLCLPVDRHVSGKSANRPTNKHGRSAVAKNGATCAGTQSSSTHGTDTGAAGGFAGD
jgi:hypothetical protein